MAIGFVINGNANTKSRCNVYQEKNANTEIS